MWFVLLPTVLSVVDARQALHDSDTFGEVGSARLLKNISDSYWAWKLGEFPRFATDHGIRDYDDVVEEFTLEAFESRKNDCETFLHRLEDVVPTELTSADRQNLAVLKADLSYFVDGYRWHMYGALNPMNFLEGYHRAPSWLGRSCHSEQCFENLFKRIRAYVRQIEQIIVLMKEAIRLKRTNHAYSMEGVIPELESHLKMSYSESAFFIPFKKMPDSINETHMETLRQRGMETIQNEVYSVLQKLKDFIINEYMHHTRTHIGVGEFDDGQAYYQACLRFHLSTNVTASEVRDIGLQEVARIKKQMEDIMRREGFEGNLSQFFHYIRNQRHDDFYGLSRDQMLEYYENIVYNIIEPKLKKAFHNIPDSKLHVRPMLRDGPSGSYSYGIFWVNLNRPEDRPTFTMMALALHEANPGHHLQTIFAKEQDLPDFRIHGAWSFKYYAVPYNFPWYTAYTEGWSLYAEYLGEEMGCYNESALELFGRYSSEIFRACRLVVDTGIHAFNMSLQEAMDYMAEHTVIPTEQIRTEVNRYITWPGQACAYKIGEIEILRLRRNAEQALGDGFDVAEFNEEVLKTSRVPLNVLDQVIDEWILRKMSLRSQSNSAGVGATSPSGVLVVQLIWTVCLLHLAVRTV